MQTSRLTTSSILVYAASAAALFGPLGCADLESGAPAIGVARSAATNLDGKQLALGHAHGCSLDAAISGIRCWGDDRRGQTDVPVLAAPSFIAAGGDTTCAISTGLVRCWGDGASGQLNVPLTLVAPSQVAVGDSHVCALTERGSVRCWGDDSYGQLRVPALTNVRTIAAGARHTCALQDRAVVCWGDNSQHQLDVPVLTAAEQLAVGGDHACVIDAGKVACWGGSIPAVLAPIPEVTAPTLIAAGATHSCVLDARGVKCWGDDRIGALTPRELTGTVQLAVGGGNGHAHACARHLQGVACWGDNALHQASYDGGPLHILHRSESNIDAPAERVWAVILDLDKYPEWNPYTIAMKSTLKVGEPMVMTVKMTADLTIEQTEYIRVLQSDETGHKACWGIDTESPEFNSGERCQWLEPLPSGGTHYITEDLIEGTANPLVTALFGDAVQVGFDAVASALKARVESLAKQ
jgi:hypothetical protein